MLSRARHNGLTARAPDNLGFSHIADDSLQTISSMLSSLNGWHNLTLLELHQKQRVELRIKLNWCRTWCSSTTESTDRVRPWARVQRDTRRPRWFQVLLPLPEGSREERA